MSEDFNQMFSQYNKGGFKETEVIDPGTYDAELKAKPRADKNTGRGYMYVEGTVVGGPQDGRYVTICTLDWNPDKNGGSISTQNVAAFGIDLGQLEQLSRQLDITAGLVPPDDKRFTEALAAAIDGRRIRVELVHNTYQGKTKMQMTPGKATYLGGGSAPSAVPPAPSTAPPVLSAPVPPAPPVAAAPPAPAAPAVPPAPPAAAAPPAPAAPPAAPEVAPAPAPEAAPPAAPAADGGEVTVTNEAPF